MRKGIAVRGRWSGVVGLAVAAVAATVAACASQAPERPVEEPVPAAELAPVEGRGAASSVRIDFVPESEEFVPAAREYERIWAEEGARVVAAMERVSGLSFVRPEYADTAITARVLEAPSSSGWQERPMRLRASYPLDTKRAALVHELGHRLQGHLFDRDEPSHPPLYLWVYDTWRELWGDDFAREQAAVERRYGERYARAWDSALGLTAAERAEAWRRTVAERSGG